MLKKILFLVFIFAANTGAALDLREDASYLEPFLNQKWEFNSPMKSEVITFSSTITTSPVNNYKSLPGIAESDVSEWNLNYDEDGYTLYYSYIEEGIGKEHHFEFQYSNTDATEVAGTYHLFAFKSLFNTSKSDKIIMGGKLLNSEQQQDDCTVIYNSENNQLHIPCVTLANGTNVKYDVKMELINAEPLEFRVTELK